MRNIFPIYLLIVYKYVDGFINYYRHAKVIFMHKNLFYCTKYLPSLLRTCLLLHGQIQKKVTDKKQRAVAWWLVAGVIMIIVQTLLGGVTRLTGSGLSITRWNPLFG